MITLNFRQERTARIDTYNLVEDVKAVFDAPYVSGQDISRCFVIRRSGDYKTPSTRESLERIAHPQDLDEYQYNPLNKFYVPNLGSHSPTSVKVDPMPPGWSCQRNQKGDANPLGACDLTDFSLTNPKLIFDKHLSATTDPQAGDYLRILSPSVNQGLYRIHYVKEVGNTWEIHIPNGTSLDTEAGIEVGEAFFVNHHNEFSVAVDPEEGNVLRVTGPVLLPAMPLTPWVTLEFGSIKTQALIMRERNESTFRDSYFCQYHTTPESMQNAAYAHQKHVERYMRQINQVTKSLGQSVISKTVI